MSPRLSIPVLDLFAGPGGLGEGFSGFRANRSHPFRIALSVEMEEQAHRTLRLRSFYRQYASNGRRVPECYYRVLRGEFPAETLSEQRPEDWLAADREALRATLGDEHGDASVAARVREARLQPGGNTVLIGGPPCQAYSLVGRARNRGIEGYVAENDHRHRLYLEYLRLIHSLWPAVFVMENVKGILSSRLDGERIFPRIVEDLSDPRRALGSRGSRSSPSHHRYRVVPVALTSDYDTRTLYDASPIHANDFVVRAEVFGIPQRRHRVFLIGVREDLRGTFMPIKSSPSSVHTSVAAAIAGLPRVRSNISSRDREADWGNAIRGGVTKALLSEIRDLHGSRVAETVRNAARHVDSKLTCGAEFMGCTATLNDDSELARWLTDSRLSGISNHSSRTHMASDLLRYLYSACFTEACGCSPTLGDFPLSLLPAHRNAKRAATDNSLFTDRFRVQAWHEPSTTITSHISKDGHYFIHPDPLQCRSLTVREAARLQTFPDNYFFCGPRTAQYIQVGNAVPPLLANKIAASVYAFLRSCGCAND